MRRREWQTISGQQPTRGFHRGETSAVVAAIVAGLVVYQGWIDRPGDLSSAIDLAVGWWLAMAAAFVALGAAIARLPTPARRPPGV